jgi:hypothetical protein
MVKRDNFRLKPAEGLKSKASGSTPLYSYHWDITEVAGRIPRSR